MFLNQYWPNVLQKQIVTMSGQHETKYTLSNKDTADVVSISTSELEDAVFLPVLALPKRDEGRGIIMLVTA